jgi:hypothetical protein
MQQEAKRCERCGLHFDCRPENIRHCQCYGIELSDAARQTIAELYQDCLCRNCLLEITKETMSN